MEFFEGEGERIFPGNLFEVGGKVIPDKRKMKERKARKKGSSRGSDVVVVLVSKIVNVLKIAVYVSLFQGGYPCGVESCWYRYLVFCNEMSERI